MKCKTERFRPFFLFFIVPPPTHEPFLPAGLAPAIDLNLWFFGGYSFQAFYFL
jgi:hypothetical protein